MSNSNAPFKRCSTVTTVTTVAVDDEISKSDAEYMDVTNLSRPIKGMRLAVIPFLSNNGKTSSLVRCSTRELVSFDVVRGKHLLICCVAIHLPLHRNSHYFRAIMEAYINLPRDTFEMVLVAGPDSTKGVFEVFCSELPCLAIPFSDLDTRHHICSFIGFNLYFLWHDLSAVLVDPDEIVIQYQVTPDRFLTYGSEWFPYHESVIEAVIIQDHVLRCRLDPFYKKVIKGRVPEAVTQDPLLHEPLSLYRDILLCDPSLALPRIGSVGGADEKLTILELSKKHVALYLYLDRELLGYLVDLHQECIEKKWDLEIIVVCIPIYDCTNSMQEKLIEHLRCEDITTWLMFPKHNNIWRRLWRVFGQGYTGDWMIILPPNGQSGELLGRAVIEECGVDEYPFTRSSILERRFADLRSLTPAELFKGNSKNRTCLVRKGKTRNVRKSSIQGKKLLLYLDWLQLKDDHGALCDLMMKLYPKIKAKGWEVVFVPLDHEDTKRHVKIAKMPWPIMPIPEGCEEDCEDDCEAFVPGKLMFHGDGNYSNQVIAFREDGKIVSREAVEGLKKHELNDSLFCDNLYDELTYILLCLR